MDAKTFADFFALQGHKVIETESCYWYNAFPFFYQSIPYHRIIRPPAKEIETIFLRNAVLGIRFCTDMDLYGKESFIWLCKDKSYSYKNLKKSSRKRTRHGLKMCRIQMIDFSWLAEHGFELITDTLIRQKRDINSISERQWKLLCYAANQFPDFDAWGGFVDDKLAVFAVAALIEDHYNILFRFSATSQLVFSPNNALHYSILKEKMFTPGVSIVSSGLDGLDSNAGLDTYKLGMGFKQKKLKQRVMFHPCLTIFVNPISYKIIEKIYRIFPKSYFWRKMRGILAVYKGGQ